MNDTQPSTPHAPAERHPTPKPRMSNRGDRPRWVRRAVGLAFALAAAGLLAKAWMPKPTAVDTGLVERRPLVVTVDEDGRARVKDRYVVSAPLSGNVGRIELHPGDSIEEHQVLARLVPLTSPLLDERSRVTGKARLAAAKAARRQADAQVERTRSALEFASAEAKRLETLVAQNVVSELELQRAVLQERTLSADLASAQFGVKVAQHELEMARAALGHLSHQADEGSQLEITSPIDGRVLKVLQESEGVVNPGSPLLEVGDPSGLEVVVDILTSDAVQVRPGARVLLERWGGEPLTGRVRMVEPSAFTRLSSLGVEEQRVNVVIDIESPHELWAALGDGYRVEAKIVVWESDAVLAVPASAVFRAEGEWAAYVVEAQVAHLRKLRVGRRSGTEVQVLEGLEPDAVVITHPSDRIEEGSAVTPRQ